MPLFLHRSNRVEALVASLCTVLGKSWPADPLQQVPIVVGSRGMERYLRHEIATRMDIACGLAFPFPRQALAGAARWLLGPAAASPAGSFWELDEGERRSAARFERDALAFRLVERLRARAEDEVFAPVSRYLAETALGPRRGGPVTARELLFARDAAKLLDRLMHDRPLEALAWAKDPAAAPDVHRWLGVLLRELEAEAGGQLPARVFPALKEAKLSRVDRVLCVFGLSTLGPGDRDRIAAVARALDVHLFVLAPTAQWFVDQRTRDEYRQAVRKAGGAEDLARIEFDRRHDNPVVAALGAASRDLQNWVEEVGYEHDDATFSDPLAAAAPGRLLLRLQRWMLQAEGRAHVKGHWSVDDSIQFHSTYGALRQCEVLRDELLRLFAGDPTLEPRDVVVMSPDIALYAPLVTAVFARRARAEDDGASGESSLGTSRLPAIPASVADLGLARTNPMAEVLLELLDLAGERLTATRVSALLSLGPVRRRFDIDDGDLGELEELIRRSGLRWGLDAGDRARVGQPARDQNTVRFAAERIALGVLMPDDDPLEVVRGADPDLGPAVPLAIEGSERTARAAALIALLRAVGAQRAALAGPLPVPEWRDRLVGALDAVAELPEASARLRAEVVDVLDALVEESGPLGDLAVERGALRRWLDGRFEVPDRGDRPITGAVSVCALQPMRSVPFRVVVLIGMDDGAFPRAARSRPWDPFERRRLGERDGREIERHLLLEAILSAREHLVFLWSGRDEQRGTGKAAALPVEELIEILADLTGAKRADLVREHPLQPWSDKAFLPTPSSHDAGLARAARQMRELYAGRGGGRAAVGLSACRATVLAEEPNPARQISIEELARALYRPQKVLLRDRFGVWLEPRDPGFEDREPIDLAALERDRELAHRVLDGLRGGPPGAARSDVVEKLEARLAGQGVLPLRAGGRRVLAAQERLARCVLCKAEAVVGTPRGDLELSSQVSATLRVAGRVADVRGHEGRLVLQWTSMYGANPLAELGAFVHLLVARAAGHPVLAARVVGPASGGEKGGRAVVLALADISPDAARSVLADLGSLYARGRRTALRLFPHASPGAARQLAKTRDEPSAIQGPVRQATAAGWYGSGFGSSAGGDIADPWVMALFGDYTPVDDLGPGPDGFLDLARRVWLPVIQAEKAGKELAPTLERDAPDEEDDA